jgi:glycosyltransferase involved in cell wall biosynthesis
MEEKMKVLLISTPFLQVSPKLNYGGTERVVYLLDSELTKKQLSAGVVAPFKSSPKSHLFPTIHDQVGVKTILDKDQEEEWNGLYLRFEHISLAIQYANSLPDVDLVHLHDDNILIFDALIKAPTLLTLHGNIDGFWVPKLNPAILKCKTKLVSISQSQKKIYEDHGFKIDYVVYNGVDQSLFQDSPDKENYLFSLGGIMPVKGQEHAILVAEKSNHDLIIAGNIGDQTYFTEKIKPKITHDLTKENDKLAAYLQLPKTKNAKIVYVGQVNDQQKGPLYSYAKAFLMPIDWEEPFGLVMVEAMMSGTPVIAFNRGSVPEIIEPNKNGFIVANVDEMIEAIPAVDKLDSKEIREMAIKQFGTAQMAQNYIKVYQDILKNN